MEALRMSSSRIHFKQAANKLIPSPLIYKKEKLRYSNFVFLKIFLLSVLLLTAVFKTRAQSNDNYTLYANIIYRVTKYINWPVHKKSGDFIIGIVGDSPLYEELKNSTNNKKVGNQKIVVKEFSSSAAFYDCQILFINEDKSRSLKKIAELTVNSPVLLMSESDGLAQKGSCINFIIVDDRLKLEINKKNIEKRNLDVASEFLSLGKIVN